MRSSGWDPDPTGSVCPSKKGRGAVPIWSGSLSVSTEEKPRTRGHKEKDSSLQKWVREPLAETEFSGTLIINLWPAELRTDKKPAVLLPRL